MATPTDGLNPTDPTPFDPIDWARRMLSQPGGPLLPSIDPVTGAPLPNLTAYIPPMGNPAPEPAAPVPKHPTLKVETIKKSGRPDRVYVDALPDTIWADGLDVNRLGGVDDKGRLCMQFHNAKDVVYIPRTEPSVWDRLYGVVEFSLHGADVEEPEDLEKKWGPSVPYDTGKGPNYVHDDS